MRGSTVIVWGPPGSGKTTHKRALARFYAKRHIVDEWALPEKLPTDALVLTCEFTPGAIHIRDALAAAGIGDESGARA